MRHFCAIFSLDQQQPLFSFIDEQFIRIMSKGFRRWNVIDAATQSFIAIYDNR